MAGPQYKPHGNGWRNIHVRRSYGVAFRAYIELDTEFPLVCVRSCDLAYRLDRTWCGVRMAS